MQLYRFKDFDTFHEALLPEEQVICSRLRQLILQNFPEVREKFGYGVPYYHRFGRICFLYPASFPYSGHPQGVALGFTRGHLLSNEQGLLDMGARKEVGYVLLRQPSELQEEPLLDMLHEAFLIDEDWQRQKIKKP
ncbi:MAG: DUF1801 domain-containing protein [Saprospiraceae bacterium]|nr:DUF1801 domain-containing protein [Saprospiraceae bacterium]